MGSTLTLTAWTADESAADRAFDEAFAEFTRLEKLMSTWVPDSDVSRVNREAGVRPVPVSAEVREVLNTARQMSEWTGGKFDVTFGVLSRRARYFSRAKGRRYTSAASARATRSIAPPASFASGGFATS